MKSHVSDLLELAEVLYKDISARCAVADPLDVRDLKTLRSRVEHEGLSFLTITLPTLGADFERSLAGGRLDPDLFRSFKKRLKAPAFLQGFFGQVFDLGTGRILDEPNVEAISGIRQMAYAFKKVQIACAPQRVRKAIVQFKQTEHDLDEPLTDPDLQYFTEVCRALWDFVLPRGEISLEDAIPKHGPGSTAERITGNGKFRHQTWHERLEPYFPLLHNAFSSENAYGSGEFQRVNLVTPDKERPVRVVTVPKTLKGPRVIAIEPVCMQYAQQALSRLITSRLESHPITRKRVNFTHQSINRMLAMSSSRNGKLATLDLSSASDRVPLSLAMRMFDHHPDLQGAIYACRTMNAKLPTKEIIRLKKFASMGSALCFPIEAMYFYTICIAGLLRSHNLPVTPPNVAKMGRRVYVYGDDIIIPTDQAAVVTEYLEKYYCKVNTQKSYWTGKFRESCGMDAYDGQDVTPVYIRQLPPCNKRNSKALISWTATANLFYWKGLWQVSRFLRKRVERYLGELPLVSKRCAALGRESIMPAVSTGRWGERYHRPEVLAWVAKPIYRTDKLGGFAALNKFFLNAHGHCDDPAVGRDPLLKLAALAALEDDLLTVEGKLPHGSYTGPSVDKKHLSRTARPGAVTLKRRWLDPA